MSTILEVILKTAGFTEGATAIKKVGDEATNTNNKLKTTTSTVDQVSKSTTSLGSKLANAGKQFSGTITNVAALGSTVVNLNRQYQDLGDTQIRVDKTQLKVSKTAEAVRGAQDKLNKLTKAGVKSGAEYEKALLDVQQAQEASTLAVTMNGEALEDQQRAYENFTMTLAPTILTAGSSITSMFKEMGGTKGIGGFVSKLKTLGPTIATSLSSGTTEATKSIGGLTSKLTDLGNVGKGGGGGGFLSNIIGSKSGMIGLLGTAAAGGLALFALQDLFDLMAKGAEIKSLNNIILSGNALISDFEKQLGQMKDLKARWDVQLEGFFFSGPIGQAVKPQTTAKIADELIIGLESAISRVKAAEPLKKLVASITSSDLTTAAKAPIIAQLNKLIAMYGSDVNWKAGYGTTAEAVAANTRKIIALGLDLVTNNINTAFATKFSAMLSGLTGAMREAFLKAHPGAEFSGMTALFAMDPTAMSDGTDAIGKRAEAIKNFGATAANAAATAAAPINYLTGLLGKMKDAVFAVHRDEGFTGLTKAFAIDPKPIAATGDAIGKLAAQVGNFSTKIDPAAARLAAYAGQARFLDENLKPLGPMFDQLVGAMETANANVNASIVGLSNYQIGAKNAVTSVAEWAKASEIKIAQDTQELASLKKLAQSYGLHTGTVGDSVEVLKLLIQAQQAAAQGNMKLATSFMDAAKAAQKANQAMAQTYAIGIKIKGYQPGSVTSGPKYVTVRKGKVIGYGPGTSPQQRKPGVGIQLKQHGYQSTVKRPTMFIAGEGGRPEDVTVRPRGSVQRGGSGGNGGGDIYVGPIYLDGQQIYGQLRYKMNENQGIFK